MHISNIATAKNRFSHLINLVKQGQTILITERNKPVATLQPVSQTIPPDLQALHASGLLKPPSQILDLAQFLAAPRASLPAGRSLAQSVLDERKEAR